MALQDALNKLVNEEVYNPGSMTTFELLQVIAYIEYLENLVTQARDEYIEANSNGDEDCVTPYDLYTMIGRPQNDREY